MPGGTPPGNKVGRFGASKAIIPRKQTNTERLQEHYAEIRRWVRIKIAIMHDSLNQMGGAEHVKLYREVLPG